MSMFDKKFFADFKYSPKQIEGFMVSAGKDLGIARRNKEPDEA